jgi:hypothetical protein
MRKPSHRGDQTAIVDQHGLQAAQKLARPCNTEMPCYSSPFTGTNRIVHLVTALQIASASATSSFWRFTYGLAYVGGINFTLCPSARNDHAHNAMRHTPPSQPGRIQLLENGGTSNLHSFRQPFTVPASSPPEPERRVSRCLWPRNTHTMAPRCRTGAVRPNRSLRVALNLLEIDCASSKALHAVMVCDLDIWHSANDLIHRYGGQAVIRAAMRADECRLAADHESCRTWQTISMVISELQRLSVNRNVSAR